LPFSIYLGWISVATIANAAVLLVDAGWTGGGLPPAVWTAALLLTAVALGTWFLYRNGDVAYAMVLTWAFFGIRTARQQDLPPQELVSWVALGGIVVLIFLSLYLVLSGKERLAD
jgi:benzodiazapine receptor